MPVRRAIKTRKTEGCLFAFLTKRFSRGGVPLSFSLPVSVSTVQVALCQPATRYNFSRGWYVYTFGSMKANILVNFSSTLRLPQHVHWNKKGRIDCLGRGTAAEQIYKSHSFARRIFFFLFFTLLCSFSENKASKVLQRGARCEHRWGETGAKGNYFYCWC